MCEEAARLLGLYTSALSAFHRAQTTVVPEGKQKSGGGELAWASRVKEAAHRNLLRARRGYWEHVREHGCRETKGRQAVTPPASRSGVDTLWNGLRQAKDQLDLAFDGLTDAREVHASSLSGTADGHYLYQRALEIQEFAASEYLRKLADFKAAIAPAQGFDNPGHDSAAGDSGQERRGVELLTEREMQVLRLIASGKSGREIAELLGIAFKTVSVHRQKIYLKLEVHKTADLVRIAMRTGLIDT